MSCIPCYSKMCRFDTSLSALKAMVSLKSSPGSQNGTGLLQTVIAMKVREIYEKITGKEILKRDGHDLYH